MRSALVVNGQKEVEIACTVHFYEGYPSILSVTGGIDSVYLRLSLNLLIKIDGLRTLRSIYHKRQFHWLARFLPLFHHLHPSCDVHHLESIHLCGYPNTSSFTVERSSPASLAHDYPRLPVTGLCIHTIFKFQYNL